MIFPSILFLKFEFKKIISSHRKQCKHVNFVLKYRTVFDPSEEGYFTDLKYIYNGLTKKNFFRLIF